MTRFGGDHLGGEKADAVRLDAAIAANMKKLRYDG
jgi:hypothetical protein